MIRIPATLGVFFLSTRLAFPAPAPAPKTPCLPPLQAIQFMLEHGLQAMMGATEETGTRLVFWLDPEHPANGFFLTRTMADKSVCLIGGGSKDMQLNGAALTKLWAQTGERV